MFDQNKKLQEIIDSEKLDTTLAMNIFINAVKSNWNNFSKVDKFLIGKVFQTLEYYANKQEDFVIKFQKDEDS